MKLDLLCAFYFCLYIKQLAQQKTHLILIHASLNQRKRYIQVLLISYYFISSPPFSCHSIIPPKFITLLKPNLRSSNSATEALLPDLQ